MLTYKEFTDEEITKAVKCCSEPCCVCDECPLYCVGANCSSFELHRYALDLINRQQAEIERLKEESSDKERAYTDEYCLRKEWQDKCRQLLIEKQTAKSEAYKEFAERLEEKSFQSFGNYGITRDVVEVCDIDNLVKEMVGDDNA